MDKKDNEDSSAGTPCNLIDLKKTQVHNGDEVSPGEVDNCEVDDDLLPPPLVPSQLVEDMEDSVFTVYPQPRLEEEGEITQSGLKRGREESPNGCLEPAEVSGQNLIEGTNESLLSDQLVSPIVQNPASMLAENKAAVIKPAKRMRRKNNKKRSIKLETPLSVEKQAMVFADDDRDAMLLAGVDNLNGSDAIDMKDGVASKLPPSIQRVPPSLPQKSGDKNGVFLCPFCNFFSHSKQGFKLHIRRHSSVKWSEADPLNSSKKCYMCNICGKELSSKCSLARHGLVHSGLKPYRCSVCSAAFTTSGNLSRHMKIHSSLQTKCATSEISVETDDDGADVSNNHCCRLCGMMFKNSKGLRMHNFMIHRMRSAVNSKGVHPIKSSPLKSPVTLTLQPVQSSTIKTPDTLNPESPISLAHILPKPGLPSPVGQTEEEALPLMKEQTLLPEKEYTCTKWAERKSRNICPINLINEKDYVTRMPASETLVSSNLMSPIVGTLSTTSKDTLQHTQSTPKSQCSETGGCSWYKPFWNPYLPLLQHNWSSYLANMNGGKNPRDVSTKPSSPMTCNTSQPDQPLDLSCGKKLPPKVLSVHTDDLGNQTEPLDLSLNKSDLDDSIDLSPKTKVNLLSHNNNNSSHIPPHLLATIPNQSMPAPHLGGPASNWLSGFRWLQSVTAMNQQMHSQPQPQPSAHHVAMDSFLASQQLTKNQVPLSPICSQTPAAAVANRFMCPHCPLSFDGSQALRIHSQSSHKSSSIPCAACEKSFPTEADRISHVRQVHAPTLVSYGDAVMAMNRSVISKSPNDPVTFLKGSTGPSWLSVVKETAPAGLARSHSLLSKATKDVEGKYKCYLCERRFNLAAALGRHVKYHNLHRPYKCPHCEAAFTYKYNCTRHITYFHPEQTPIPPSSLSPDDREPTGGREACPRHLLPPDDEDDDDDMETQMPQCILSVLRESLSTCDKSGEGRELHPPVLEDEDKMDSLCFDSVNQTSNGPSCPSETSPGEVIYGVS